MTTKLCLKCDQPLVGLHERCKYHRECRPETARERRDMAIKAWNIAWGGKACSWCGEEPVAKGYEPHCTVCHRRIESAEWLIADMEYLQYGVCTYWWRTEEERTSWADEEKSSWLCGGFIRSVFLLMANNHRIRRHPEAFRLGVRGYDLPPRANESNGAPEPDVRGILDAIFKRKEIDDDDQDD